MGALAFLGQGLALLPSLIKAGIDAYALITRMKKVADADAVAAEDWDALHALEAQLRGRLHSDQD